MEIWGERSSMDDTRDIQDRAGRQEFLFNEISRVTAVVGLSCPRLGHISEGWAQSSRLRGGEGIGGSSRHTRNIPSDEILNASKHVHCCSSSYCWYLCYEMTLWPACAFFTKKRELHGHDIKSPSVRGLWY